MARNNYKSEKRRKELKRKKKNEEKQLRRLEKKNEGEPGQNDIEQADENEVPNQDSSE